jgi:outer membrane protein
MIRVKYSWAVAVWAGVAATLFLSLPLKAQTSHPQAVRTIGVIDVQRILRQSAAYKSIRPQMQNLKKGFEEKFRTAEGKLRTANKDLQQERAILSPEAFTLRQQKFRKEVDALQRNMQLVNRLLELALSNGVGKIQLRARDITKEIAGELKLDLIVSNAAITFAKPQLDLTDKVLSRLNKRLPTVKIVLPQSPKSSAGKKK